MTKDTVSNVAIILALVLALVTSFSTVMIIREKAQVRLISQSVETYKISADKALKDLNTQVDNNSALVASNYQLKKNNDALAAQNEALNSKIASLEDKVNSLTIEVQDYKKHRVATIKKPVVKKKKRIPYDIAPSQQ